MMMLNGFNITQRFSQSSLDYEAALGESLCDVNFFDVDFFSASLEIFHFWATFHWYSNLTFQVCEYFHQD